MTRGSDLTTSSGNASDGNLTAGQIELLRDTIVNANVESIELCLAVEDGSIIGRKFGQKVLDGRRTRRLSKEWRGSRRRGGRILANNLLDYIRRSIWWRRKTFKRKQYLNVSNDRTKHHRKVRKAVQLK